MQSLFSTFDPCSWWNFNLNWTILPLTFAFLPSIFWVPKSQIPVSSHLVKTTLLKEFRSILTSPPTSWILLIPIALFWLILLVNSAGLLPHVFTASRRLALTASLALPLWFGHIILAFYFNPVSSLAHLLPTGTPPILYPFIVLIEIVRNCIRPVTLAVRLAANILAGHLLLSILRGNTQSIIWGSARGVIAALILLCVLETAVRIIQAYVFRALRSLYFREVNSPTLS